MIERGHFEVGLHNLKREYEERRTALVDQLRRNSKLDAGSQHQIYGAVKEIELFLSAIDQQIESEQSLSIDLERERPRPMVERTKKAVSRVKNGTKSVFTEKIPAAGKKVASVPKSYLEKQRQKKELRRRIEEEMKLREQQGWPMHIREVMPPPLPEKAEPRGGLSGTLANVHLEPDTADVDVLKEEHDNPRNEEMGEDKIYDLVVEEKLSSTPRKPKKAPKRPPKKPSKKVVKKKASKKKKSAKKKAKKKK